MDELQNVIERCENRASFLGNKVSEISKSVEAVNESCKNARFSLDLHYQKIKLEVMKAIDGHYHSLVDYIERANKKDIDLLLGIKNQFLSDLDLVTSLISQGKALGKDESQTEEKCVEDELPTQSSITEEIQKSLDGLARSHSDIPCSSMSVVVTLDDAKLQTSIDGLKSCMDVSLIGGVHITECIEMPGAIKIKWDEPSVELESVETDNSIVTEYTLQYSSTQPGPANSDVLEEAVLVFNTLYTGEEMQYLMTDVEINRSYYFRVCRSRNKAGCTGITEPWSISKRGWTTLSPYEWSKEDCLNEGMLTVYELGNDNKTATKVFPESCKVLRSNSASYRIGHTVNFNIDEAGERSSKDGIGLITKRFEKTLGELLIFSDDSIIVNSKGAIYVNGLEMTMKLPVFKRGSTLSFQTSLLLAGKLRVTISSEDKEVTFDWPTGGEDHELSFASSFEHTGWQITVS